MSTTRGGCTVIISAAVPPEMRDELVRRAAEADRSLSREIGRGLTRYLNEVPSGSQRRASVPPRAPAADIEGT